MIRKILGFFALIVIMAAALVAYSMKSTVPNVSEMNKTVDGYKQQVVDKTKEVAAPVLKEAGIDVEKVPQSTDDLNVVKQQMQDATDKVNEATKTLTQ